MVRKQESQELVHGVWKPAALRLLSSGIPNRRLHPDSLLDLELEGGSVGVRNVRLVLERSCQERRVLTQSPGCIHILQSMHTLRGQDTELDHRGWNPARKKIARSSI